MHSRRGKRPQDQVKLFADVDVSCSQLQVLADFVGFMSRLDDLRLTSVAASPLNQYELLANVPTLRFDTEQSEQSTISPIQQMKNVLIPPTPSRPLISSPTPEALQMTEAQIQNNPLVDYTTPDLVTLVVSDVGILTPAGVSDTLLRIYSG